jgi:hypothetical protein
MSIMVNIVFYSISFFLSKTISAMLNKTRQMKFTHMISSHKWEKSAEIMCVIMYIKNKISHLFHWDLFEYARIRTFSKFMSSLK